MSQSDYREIKDVSDKIALLLNNVEKPTDNSTSVGLLEREIRQFHVLLDTAFLELRNEKVEAASRKQIKQLLRDHKDTLKNFQKQFELLRNTQVKKELFEGFERYENPIHPTGSESLMTHGLDVQEKSKVSLKNTLKTVNDSKLIAQDISIKLEQNLEKTVKTHDKLEQTESVLRRSVQVIRQIARKITTDKYVWVMVLLVLFLIVFLSVWKQ